MTTKAHLKTLLAVSYLLWQGNGMYQEDGDANVYRIVRNDYGGVVVENRSREPNAMGDFSWLTASSADASGILGRYVSDLIDDGVVKLDKSKRTQYRDIPKQ